MEERTGERIEAFANENDVRAIGGPLKDEGLALAQLLWHCSNFYKHRDDWPQQAWFPDLDDEGDGDDLKRRLKDARRIISKLEPTGASHGSTGNMRTLLGYLSGVKKGQCRAVAVVVQSWAKEVGAVANNELEAIAARWTPGPRDDDASD